jgi:C_GCAxxG_C_C family probable redox protein
MNRPAVAVAAFKEGYSCSQAILVAHAEALGLPRQTALRIASGFGGGMGRLAETCGAVTGSVMVLGLRYGGVAAADREAKEQTYARVQEFVSRFQARCGATTCRKLLGCDISTPEGLQQAQDQGLTVTLCPQFVLAAAEVLEELL